MLQGDGEIIRARRATIALTDPVFFAFQVVQLNCLQHQQFSQEDTISLWFNSQEFNVKVQRSVRWNDAGVTAGAVGKVRRANQTGALSDAHLSNSLIPTLDHFSLADAELEGSATVATRVKLASVV